MNEWPTGADHLAVFVASLNQIPWLRHLGRPSPRDHEVFRIYSWTTWPGPEDPGAELQASYYRRWKNEVFGIDDYTSVPHDALWTTIHDTVFAAARLAVPYNDNEDAWYGPNAAVWEASYCAALVGCTIRMYGQMPPPSEGQWTLMNNWSWFAAGHWPCLYFWSWGYTDLAAVERTHVSKRLVVY